MRMIDADRLSLVLQKNFGHTDAAEVMQQIIDAQPTIEITREEHPKWISVTDALPKLPPMWHVGVIAYNGRDVEYLLYERANVCGITVSRWMYPELAIYHGPPITHWMPLPGAPNHCSAFMNKKE